MDDKKKFLRVVRDLKKEMIIIEGNYKGLLSLYKHIELLLNIKTEYFKDGKAADVDLMIPEWGGDELNEEKPSSEDLVVIAYLRIYRWED
jgi:hypothetical protein